MDESDYAALTVVKLKGLLQERSLSVSGKKAELVARLVAGDGASKPSSAGPKIATKATKVTEATEDEAGLPFLTSIRVNGFKSVEIDRDVAIRYGAACFMLLMIIIGLNSSSWYSYEISTSSTSFDFSTGEATDVNSKDEYAFGLSGFEHTNTTGGSEESVKTMEQSYDSGMCESEMTPFDCGAFSAAGNVNKLLLLISMLSIIILLGVSIAQGFGKLNTGFFVEHSEKYNKYVWTLSSVPIFIGSLLYGIITSIAPASSGGGMGLSISSGWGAMMWSMAIFSMAFVIYIHQQLLLNLVQKVTGKSA